MRKILSVHFESGKPTIMPFHLLIRTKGNKNGVKSDFQGFVEEKVFIYIEIICRKKRTVVHGEMEEAVLSHVHENHKDWLSHCVPCLLLDNPACALEGQAAQYIFSAS